MSLTLQLISLYLFFSTLLTLVFSAYAFAKQRAVITTIFACLCGSIGIYTLGYLMELNSTSLGQMSFWNQVQYIGIPFYPAFWLLLSLLYDKKSQYLSPRWLMMILAIPVCTFFLRLTNDIHFLYYSSMVLDAYHGHPILLLGKGIWYYVQGIYLYLCFMVSLVIFTRKALKIWSPNRQSAQLMILAPSLQFMGFIFILVNLGDTGLDYSALIFPITLSMLMVALFKFDFLDFNALARDRVFENSRDALILMDKENYVVDYNQSAKEILPTIQKNQHSDQIIEISQLDDFQTLLDGQEAYFDVKKIPISNKNNVEIGIMISLVEVTERKYAQDALRKMATTDDLTGLWNRNYFMQLAKSEIQKCMIDQQTVSLLMMDLDHFKQINDTYGHSGGDVVLRNFGMILKQHFRHSDIIGRIGGEEFAVLLTRSSEKDAFFVAEGFRRKVESTTIISDDHQFHVTVSIGVAQCSESIHSFADLLKFADQALYTSKRSGRNRTS